MTAYEFLFLYSSFLIKFESNCKKRVVSNKTLLVGRLLTCVAVVIEHGKDLTGAKQTKIKAGEGKQVVFFLCS